MVTPEQVELGVLRQRKTGLRIGEQLVDMGVVTEEDVGWGLSRQLGLSFVDIDLDALDATVVRSFPEALLRRCDALPLLRAENAVSIAVADPTDERTLDRLEAAAGVPLLLVIGTPAAIRRGLDHVLGARIAAAADPAESATSAARLYDVVWEKSGDTFLAFHVASAIRLGADEIHFLPDDGQLRVFYRQQSRLVEAACEPGRVLESLLARIEALGGPVPGDALHVRGHVRCPIPHGDVRLDVSLVATAGGVCVTLVHRHDAVTPTLEALGMSAVDAAELRGALGAGAGLVLVGGPRGAGGSTLLAALAAHATSAFGRAEGSARVVVVEAASASGGGCFAPGGPITRLALDPALARTAWPEIAAAQRADVVVLDDVLAGDAVSGALDGAGSGRLLLVRTDWCDSAALLAHLRARPEERARLARRLLAVIQVRRVPVMGPATDAPPFLFESLVLSEPLRDALEEGVDATRLIELATAGGFRSLGRRAAEAIAAGTWPAAAVARART